MPMTGTLQDVIELQLLVDEIEQLAVGRFLYYKQAVENDIAAAIEVALGSFRTNTYPRDSVSEDRPVGVLRLQMLTRLLKGFVVRECLDGPRTPTQLETLLIEVRTAMASIEPPSDVDATDTTPTQEPDGDEGSLGVDPPGSCPAGFHHNGTGECEPNRP